MYAFMIMVSGFRVYHYIQTASMVNMLYFYTNIVLGIEQCGSIVTFRVIRHVCCPVVDDN